MRGSDEKTTREAQVRETSESRAIGTELGDYMKESLERKILLRSNEALDSVFLTLSLFWL